MLEKIKEKHDLLASKLFLSFPDKIVSFFIDWLHESEFEDLIYKVDLFSKENKKYEKYKKMIINTLEKRKISVKNRELLWK